MYKMNNILAAFSHRLLTFLLNENEDKGIFDLKFYLMFQGFILAVLYFVSLFIKYFICLFFGYL